MLRRDFLKGLGALATFAVIPAQALARGKFDGTEIERCPIVYDDEGFFTPEQADLFFRSLIVEPSIIRAEPIKFVFTPWDMDDFMRVVRERGVA